MFTREGSGCIKMKPGEVSKRTLIEKDQEE